MLGSARDDENNINLDHMEFNIQHNNEDDEEDQAIRMLEINSANRPQESANVQDELDNNEQNAIQNPEALPAS